MRFAAIKHVFWFLRPLRALQRGIANPAGEVSLLRHVQSRPPPRRIESLMTLAWYGHLKFRWLEGRPLIVAILVAWGVAFFEYCLQVPANRLGYMTERMSGYQLKVIQEVITLVVFIVFAWVVLKERLTWN